MRWGGCKEEKKHKARPVKGKKYAPQSEQKKVQTTKTNEFRTIQDSEKNLKLQKMAWVTSLANVATALTKA